MKPRNVKDLRELSDEDLRNVLEEAQETLSKQKFQHALSQLQDTAYLKIIKKDIARVITILKERGQVI